MRRQLALRLTDLAFVLLGVSVVSFLLIRLIPGDAVQIMLGANTEITPERLAALRTRIGIDQPMLQQYLQWMGKLFQGDLGTSIWTGVPVADEILARIGVTLELAGLSLAASILLSVPAGCLMAYLHSSAADLAIRILTIVGLTIPSFWLGSVLIYGFHAWVPGYPTIGWVPFAADPAGNLQRMLLPVFSLALPIVASLSRIMRTAMLDALGQDYVRTARAKGASELSVVFHHAMRNALIPYVTTVGIMAGYLFGGAIVVEQVFALPGLGRLMLGAIAERNYPLIQAAILLVTASFVLINFAIDMLYFAIDPRVARR